MLLFPFFGNGDRECFRGYGQGVFEKGFYDTAIQSYGIVLVVGEGEVIERNFFVGGKFREVLAQWMLYNVDVLVEAFQVGQCWEVREARTRFLFRKMTGTPAHETGYVTLRLHLL